MAAENFSVKQFNCITELALRVTAERVSKQVLLYRRGQDSTYLANKGKILVCVGSRAESSKLIRAARRMATKLQADWIGARGYTTN